MPHLNRTLTVRLAAINAALAGCLPEYFPVVLAAWDAFRGDGRGPARSGSAPRGRRRSSVVNGPVRTGSG